MTIFDLLLIAVVLATAAGFLFALIQAVTGRLSSALKTALTVFSGLAVYLAAVCLVSLTSVQTIRTLGDPDCSDDWCISPEKAHFQGGEITIDFRVWSRAKRVTQREYGIAPYLKDDHGRKFTSTQDAGPPFDRAVAPDESFRTSRRYRVDSTPGTLDLVIREGFGPATFVIGDSQSLLHPRTVYRLRPSRGPV